MVRFREAAKWIAYLIGAVILLGSFDGSRVDLKLLIPIIALVYFSFRQRKQIADLHERVEKLETLVIESLYEK